ncbi:hypothetical protein [Clostridium butyricum]|uniref:hypothetical protein n=1 Tax=Clostridium butyricum TaxID=1492 RepID=UPI00374F4E80
MGNSNNKSLKDYDKQLLTFFIVNIVLFIVFAINRNIDINNLNQNYNDITKNSIIAGGGGTLVIFILKGILSSDIKASIVFWRIKSPLPGCRIFTKIGIKDCRIDFKALEDKHGALPKDPVEQNKLWYKFLSKYRDDEMISKSHRDYLFSRDLTALAFLFLIFYSIAAIFINKGITSVWIYLFILLIQYLILSIVSQNYGNRFACNVLAKESSSVK